MQNQQLSDVKGKELVAAGHAFAKAIGMDTPLIEIAKMMAELATRLDCALVRGDELEAQRDALAENEGYKQAFYEMAEILGIGARADSPKNVFEQVIKPMLINLQKERDQLAAENAAIKTMNDVLSEELRGYESDGAYDGPIAHKLWHSNSENPATDAYLNSVRAEGVDYVAEAIGAKCAELKVGSKDWKALKSIVFTLGDFAAQLRAGKDGE